MRDFSIDSQAEKIHSSKTREYFTEVIKSYYNESYRSAVVMLYSIAIADLLFKITELEELYNDESAIAILAEIGELQKNKTNLSEWESKLIELVKDKTNLLEPADYLNLTSLQKHRHLCAHPVITEHFELYQPNKETTRAHIRNILEGILTKPALLSRKILDDLLQNLSKVKNQFFSDEQLEKHLLDRYFSKLSSKVTTKIFRSVWKLTFVLNDPLCEENREINFRALKIILKFQYNELIKLIADEKNYYSDFDEEHAIFIIILLNSFPGVFEALNDTAKIQIGNLTKNYADYDACAIFLSSNIEDHIAKILDITWKNDYEDNSIRIDTIIMVFEYTVMLNRDLAYSFLINMFGNSNQFAEADLRYYGLIGPYLDKFSEKELYKIVKAVNKNGQINSRTKARRTNQEIKSQLEKISNEEIDLSKYHNFRI